MEGRRWVSRMKLFLNLCPGRERKGKRRGGGGKIEKGMWGM